MTQLSQVEGVPEFLELQTLVLLLLFAGDFKRAVYRLQLLNSLNSSSARLACQELQNSFNLRKLSNNLKTDAKVMKKNESAGMSYEFLTPLSNS